ncbi:hypothetical protein [Mesobacillus subterraneus]|uniref:hypothetical protein n=1 Tax=Mesobacillus subterraneus TaxID=285983 RepID=UPI001CFC9137|nr:hypothetical protein [Mesobacillus subterraneus]
MLKLSLSIEDFRRYLIKQVDQFFPDGISLSSTKDFEKVFDKALQRIELCFANVTLKSYRQNGIPYLNHLHSDQYTVFLWILSNTAWTELQDENLASKFFYLNKALNGFSCMYDTKLPNVFLLLHSTGIVLGKAEYNDYLVVSQGSTVGAHKGIYPVLGKGVGLLPNSSIIGNSNIGNRSSIGINSTIYLQNVEEETVAFTDSKGVLTYKRKKTPCWSQQFFSVEI